MMRCWTLMVTTGPMRRQRQEPGSTPLLPSPSSRVLRTEPVCVGGSPSMLDGLLLTSASSGPRLGRQGCQEGLLLIFFFLVAVSLSSSTFAASGRWPLVGLAGQLLQVRGLPSTPGGQQEVPQGASMPRHSPWPG